MFLLILVMSTTDTTLVCIVNNLLLPHITVKFVMSEFCCTSGLISVMSLLYVQCLSLPQFEFVAHKLFKSTRLSFFHGDPGPQLQDGFGFFYVSFFLGTIITLKTGNFLHHKILHNFSHNPSRGDQLWVRSCEFTLLSLITCQMTSCDQFFVKLCHPSITPQNSYIILFSFLFLVKL